MIKEVRAVIATTSVANQLARVSMFNDLVKFAPPGVPTGCRRIKIAPSEAEQLTTEQWTALEGVIREEFGDKFIASRVVQHDSVKFYLLYFKSASSA